MTRGAFDAELERIAGRVMAQARRSAKADARRICAASSSLDELIALAHGDPRAPVELRRLAVWFLGRWSLGPARRVTAALTALTASDSATIRAYAVRALAERDAIGKSTSAHVVSMLSDRSPQVRAAAAWALIDAPRTPLTVRALLRTTRDTAERPLIRGLAAEALGSGGVRSAIPALRANMRDRSRLVRRDARWALAELARQAARARKR